MLLDCVGSYLVDQGPWPKMETSCHFLRKHSLCAEHNYIGGRNLV